LESSLEDLDNCHVEFKNQESSRPYGWNLQGEAS
jgi:hypothetical protein